MKTDKKVQYAFWNDRARLGAAAGSNDVIAKRLEMDAIASYVRPGMKILDFGCGNGITAIEIAQRYPVEILGIDFAPQMVRHAQNSAVGLHQNSKARFEVGDEETLYALKERFDLIYTERVLINLTDWPAQQKTIQALTTLLKPGAYYVMCENSQDGLAAVNVLRAALNLPAIDPPWHNRYFREAEVSSLKIRGISLIDVFHFSSTYYFLSRVVNAALAAQEGKEPAYDSSVNQLALNLPSIGQFGQGKIWLWQRNV